MLASDALYETVSSRIGAVEGAVDLSQRLRDMLFTEHDPAAANAELEALKDPRLEPTEWRVYDHCAAVTRLYALLDGFVDALLRLWLDALPSYLGDYADFPEKLKREHARRTGMLLEHLDWYRYQHLTVELVTAGLYAAVRGEKYSLLPEAFLFRENNLRAESLTQLFAACQIPGAWNWVEGHPGVIEFFDEERPDGNAATELKTLLEYRNDAAHGGVDEILAPDELRIYCRFVAAVCVALKELVDAHHVRGLANIGAATDLGEVTETFKHDAVVATIVGSVSKGDALFAVRTDRCHVVTVQSIQLNDEDVDAVQANEVQEVGLLFDRRLPKKTRLFAIKQADQGGVKETIS